MKAQACEEPMSLTQYVEIGVRRRWWILGMLFVVWTGVWSATWLLPARYRSETTILIDELQVPAQKVGEESGPGLQARLQTLTPQILSRTRLQRIIEDLKLYGEGKGRPAPEALVSQMRRDIKVQPLQVAGRPDELAAFTLSYSAHSPALAQQVAKRLTSFFIEEDVRTRAERSQQTSSFLDAQLEDARAWLQKQETRLQQFKAQYLGQLPSQMQANVAELGALDNRLQNAREELQRAQQQKVYLNSLLTQYRELRVAGSSASSDVTQTPPALDAELTRLSRQMGELRLRYTEEHPDLIQLRQQLASTEKLKAQMQRELTVEGGIAPRVESAASAQIQSQLKANELEISDRQKEMGGVQVEMRAARGRLRNTPIREQQLAELTRDYDQSRAYYESLLAKKNQTQLASSLEQRQPGEQFRILDPPSLPSGPYFPNRFRFALAGLLLGAVAGGAAAYGCEMLDDHIHSRGEVETLYAVPILATIPPAPEPDSWLRRLRVGGEIAGATALLAFVTGSTFLAFIARYRD